MKKLTILVFTFCCLMIGVSCKRKHDPNKILDGLPVDVTQPIVPAQAIVESMQLKKDLFAFVVPIFNKLTVPGLTFDELENLGGGSRQFQISDPHYGVANVVMQFLDSNGALINPDPVEVRSSTGMVQAMRLIVSTMTPHRFDYNETLIITLATLGELTSSKYLTGSANFIGSGYTISFVYPSPGILGTLEGLYQGGFTGTGTSPGVQNASFSMVYADDHSANGTISWEENSGSIHIGDVGNGFIITDQSRLTVN